MKILVCPDSFKGTISAAKVSQIISSELIKAGIKAEPLPIADGGEGTLDAITSVVPCIKRYIPTINPLKKRITAYYAISGKSAYMEYAICCGLNLIKPGNRNPLISTSAGFGILLDDALRKRFNKIYIGIGGSATNDAGLGMLQALGVKFYDKSGDDISERKILTAEDLNRINDFDLTALHKKIENTEIIILSDVKNPLTGKKGSSYIYAHQKGAEVNEIKQLDNYVKHFAKITKDKLNVNTQFPGAGAAGGIGFALKIFLNGIIISGIEGISVIMGVEEKIKSSDIVIVGEGSLDYQTAFGKAPAGIASLAKKYNKYVVGISGKVGEKAEELLKKNIDTIYACYGNIQTTQEIRKKSEMDLKKVTRKFINDFKNKKLQKKITLLYG